MTLILSCFKSTVLLWFFALVACGNQGREPGPKSVAPAEHLSAPDTPVTTAANRTDRYFPLLRGKRVAVVANQTSVLFTASQPVHLVDTLMASGIEVTKVFAPEHGFRGQADAGEKVTDGMDDKTGLPIVSLYGKNRKPSPKHLEDVDVLLFDIQDVGVRFYTYIATLQLVMEAAADAGLPVIVLDRPNPNAHYVDGPTMEAAHTGFLGLTQIPLVYGMTIGEYALMINGEGWLEGGEKADLNVVPLDHWDHDTIYSLPIRPSPNLPNDTSIHLYPSLGLFEGTNVNAGRGTEFQFQRYGASFLDSTQYEFTYVPRPNFGSKTPKEEGKKCYGKDLSNIPRMNEVSLKWLMDAYQNTADKSSFFLTSGFTKHAGTELLQKQIEAGLSEAEIKAGWQEDLERFKKIRAKYLLYTPL
ncbi:exo-beta-N-acetylmuramidase NamZ domain-containing protein [Maribacter sp. 2307ULW6-5]|uniref:exo-beta-N-acetylmuramidase NamZ family protein n=1 Tax=Maribacter sp. 2307ULW6-5 TaxID=3386275 RepID=UPI0039BD8FA4